MLSLSDVKLISQTNPTNKVCFHLQAGCPRRRCSRHGVGARRPTRSSARGTPSTCPLPVTTSTSPTRRASPCASPPSVSGPHCQGKPREFFILPKYREFCIFILLTSAVAVARNTSPRLLISNFVCSSCKEPDSKEGYLLI